MFGNGGTMMVTGGSSMDGHMTLDGAMMISRGIAVGAAIDGAMLVGKAMELI